MSDKKDQKWQEALARHGWRGKLEKAPCGHFQLTFRHPTKPGRVTWTCQGEWFHHPPEK